MSQETNKKQTEEKRQTIQNRLTSTVNVLGVSVQLWVIIVVVVLVAYLLYKRSNKSDSASKSVTLSGPDVSVVKSLGTETPNEVRKLFRGNF